MNRLAMLPLDQTNRVEINPREVEAFVQLFNEVPVRDLVRNLTVAVEAFEIAGRFFPLTLNDRSEAPNCYICCPSSAYIDYAIDETRNFVSSPVLQRVIRMLIGLCAPLVRIAASTIRFRSTTGSIRPIRCRCSIATRSLRSATISRRVFPIALFSSAP
ncbi:MULTISPECIES: hypothetical protein [unclassified Mesorhizobium]|uniref:hypothetical protein n=1 Tax=unclassified Mesorhizobium TaxID=325217 RepID=UPI001AEC1C2F|nr:MULTISPECIES: hypothetical protein [unclassified Mesorhizobium]WJI51410.1 hypothetical protein NLY44_01395 [Mesorhizobium sp. C089B]